MSSGTELRQVLRIFLPTLLDTNHLLFTVVCRMIHYINAFLLNVICFFLMVYLLYISVLVNYVNGTI